MSMNGPQRPERRIRGCSRRGFAVTVVVALSLFGRLPASAQDANSPAAMDLRDAIIRDLLQRVEKLERERSAPAAGAGSPNAPASMAEKPTPSGQKTNSSQPSTQAPPPGAPQQAPQTSSEPAKPGPGEFTVSEEDAQRALERALVQTGVALLPLGSFEFVPSLTYQFRRISQPGQIALTSTGTVLITENVTRSTQLEAKGLIRVGLPWNAQAEFGLPWVYKGLAVASRVNGAGLSENAVDVLGLGDFTFSLTKQILAEGDVRPGLFVSGTWDSNFGQIKSHVPVGTGFDELSAGLAVVKRQDPLVFTVGFSYQRTLEHNGFEPGDQYSPSFGVILAVSPETSLRISQQISFGSKDAFNGKPIPGSEKTAGVFAFGLLSVLGPGRVVNFTAGIGETPDAPNFFIQLAFPIRVN